jgi:hypothetical protein
MLYRSCNRFEKTCIGLMTKPILFVRPLLRSCKNSVSQLTSHFQLKNCHATFTHIHPFIYYLFYIGNLMFYNSI